MKRSPLTERFQQLAGLKPLYEDDQVHGSSKAQGLSTIDPETADATIGGGDEDGNSTDDQVAGNKVGIPVSQLKPAQKEIILVKAFNMALNTKGVGGEYPAGGDIGAIASADNHIMDGHHRWAATYLIDPSAEVEVTQIDLDGGPLVTALNLYTKGKLGINKGNKGSGNVAEFTGENLQSKIIDVAKESGKSPDSPDGKAPGYTWEELQKRLTTFGGGSFEKGLAKIKANADKLPKNIMSGAPSRVEMPVIDKSKVADVKMRLAKGNLDIKPPFGPELKLALGDDNTSLGDKPKKQKAKNVNEMQPTSDFDKYRASLQNTGEHGRRGDLYSDDPNLVDMEDYINQIKGMSKVQAISYLIDQGLSDDETLSIVATLNTDVKDMFNSGEDDYNIKHNELDEAMNLSGDLSSITANVNQKIGINIRNMLSYAAFVLDDLVAAGNNDYNVRDFLKRSIDEI